MIGLLASIPMAFGNLLTDENVVTYDMNGDVIMMIYVPHARREQRPVYINNNLWNGTYRRNWEGDYHCTQAEIKAMLRDQPEETICTRWNCKG